MLASKFLEKFFYLFGYEIYKKDFRKNKYLNCLNWEYQKRIILPLLPQAYIKKFPDNYFDIVLVDGRSRPSCLFHSLNKVKKGGLLVLDNAEREYYLCKGIIDKNKYKLILSLNSALISNSVFTQTNIYSKEC